MGTLSGLTERFSSPAEFLAKRGVDLTDADQVKATLANPKLMNEAAGFGYTRGMIIGAFDAASGGLAGMAFGGPVRNMVSQLAIQSFMGGGGEAMAQLATDGAIDWGEVVLEALGEFSTAPLEVAGVGGRYLKEARAARRAEAAREIADEGNKAALASALAERAPAQAAEHKAAVLRASGVDKISIPADKLAEFAQSQDGDWLANLGVADQIEEAQALGGDVEIGVDAFATYIYGTENYVTLADHIRWEQDGLTSLEGKELQAGGPEEEKQRIMAEWEALPDSGAVEVAQIQAEVEAQLTAIGETPEAAGFAATLMAQRYATRAQAAGASPLDLWRKDNVSIVAGERPDPVTDLTVLLDKARSTDAASFLKLPKSPMIDYLIAKGGVDPQSNLAAELKHAGITNKTRPGLFKKGGLKAADNFVHNEIDFLDTAERTDDGYVAQDEVIAAVRDELAGNPRRSANQQTDIENFTGDVENLFAILEEAGLSINSPEADIRAALAARGYEQAATDSDGSFDADDPRILSQDARGTIQFRKDATVISLGARADRSTFLHETGHLFLEQLRADAKEFGAANQALVDDWNTVRDWWAGNAASLKAEAIDYARRAGDDDAVAALAGMSDDQVARVARMGALDGDEFGQGGPARRDPNAMAYLGRAMHEQWARGAEDYFRTGQAPSVALQDAFNRFRAWLVSIYRAMRGRRLDVQFSPDVKAVMDRLLATDEEIALVEEQYNLRALFGSAEEIGMTPGQFAAYQRAAARASEDAKTRQVKKHLNDIEREKTAWWEEERAKVAADVAAEIHQRPVYRAIFGLARGTSPDGEALTLQPGRLSRRGVVAVLENEASLARLPKVRSRAVYEPKKGGTHPDVIAQLYGYEDGRSMLMDMMNALPMDQAISDETDARMKAKFGDLLDAGGVEAALESAHADKRGDVLAMELNALRGSKDKLKPAFIRQWAKERIGTRKIENIRPETFLAAERKAGREAGKLLRKGDRLGAQREKFRQLMNFYMAKEAYAVRDEVAKQRTYLAQFGNPRKKWAGIDADYVDQIRGILEAYNLMPRMSDKKRAQLMTWAAIEAENGAIMEIPPEIAAADGRTHFRDLTLDEWRTLHDTIKTIEAQGRLKKSTIIAGEQRDLEEMADEIVANLAKLPQNKRMARKATEQNPGAFDKVQGKLAGFDASLRKVEFLLEIMDGGKGGPAHRYIFQTFADAERARNDLTVSTTKVLMDAVPKLKNKGEKIHVGQMKRTFRRSDLIMMALNVGNESNYQKMLEGSAKDVTEGAVPWTEESIDEALSHLTAEEWEFVFTVWDTNESIYPQVEAVYRRENGVSPERIVPREVTTRHGQVHKGGYHPMMYDPSRSTMAADIEGKSALEAMQSPMVKASVFSGMTKARTGFSAPVLLDIEKLPNHIQSTAHFITHYEAVRATRRLVSRQDVVKAVVNTMGREYYDTVKAWVGEIAANGQPQNPASVIGRIVEAMRKNATVAIMGFSYTTMASQLLGYANSIDALARNGDGTYSPRKGAKWLVTGMVQYLRNPAEAKRRVFALSGEMRHRLQNTDRDIRHGMVKLAGKTGAWPSFQRFSLMGIAGIQLYMVDFPVWIGAYNRAVATGATGDEAVRAADNVLRTSQMAGGLKDLSAIQRERGVTTALTMFYSYFNLLYNLQAQAIGGVKGARDVPQLAARALVLMVIPTALEAIMRQEGPDEDDEEDYATWLALKAAVYGASSLPLVRDLMGMVDGFGYSLSPLDSLGESLGRSVKGVAKAWDNGEMDAKTLKAMLSALGFAVGAPVTQINRVIDAADAMHEGEDVSPYDFLVGHKEKK
jgi:hypothetical protein